MLPVPVAANSSSPSYEIKIAAGSLATVGKCARKFVGKDAYAQFLSQQDMSISDFEAYTSEQVLLNRLRSVILESTIVSKADIEQEFKLKNEKAAIEYVKIDPEKLKEEVKVAPEEMREYFEKNKANFRILEKRGMKLVVLDPARLSESVTISEGQVRLAYEQNKDRYRTPERVKARHILLMTTGKSPDEEVKIKAKAEDLLKQIRAGASFEEIAKKNSDGATAAQGGDLGEAFERGKLAKQLEDLTFAMKKDQVSDVIRTKQGFVILKVTEHQPAGIPAMSQIENRLQEAVYMQKLQPALREYLKKLREEAYIHVNPPYVDTGASPNQTQPVVTTAAKEASARELKKKKKIGLF